MKNSSHRIAENRKARRDYHIEDTLECGIVLQGWEVKSLRSGKVQLRDSYIKFINNEAWLAGSLINPTVHASTHITTDSQRMRKLLLRRREINRLAGLVDRQGYTVIALSMHWSRGNVKVLAGLAKGRKTHDKRQLIKERDWTRRRARVLSAHLKGKSATRH